MTCCLTFDHLIIKLGDSFYWTREIDWCWKQIYGQCFIAFNIVFVKERKKWKSTIHIYPVNWTLEAGGGEWYTESKHQIELGWYQWYSLTVDIKYDFTKWIFIKKLWKKQAADQVFYFTFSLFLFKTKKKFFIFFNKIFHWVFYIFLHL